MSGSILNGLIFWLCLCPLAGQGQELIWEKKFPLSTYERFSCIVKAESGNFLAFGTTEKWRILNPVQGGAFIMKLNENGDSLWTKWTGYYGGFNKVIKGENGILYGLLAYTDTTTLVDKYGIYMFTEDGISLGIIPLQVSNVTLLDMEFRHGYIWISGQKTPSLFYPPGFTYDFWLMKLRPDGSEVFSYVYNANDPTSRGRKMEFMPNGNILFSGSVGNKIGAFEIDTAGVEIQYRTYFQNPINSGWQDASVLQMPLLNKIIFGNRSSSPSSFFLGKIDPLSTFHWGGFARGGSTVPMVFSDGSIIHINNISTPETSRIRRISKDSTLIWSLDLLGGGLIAGRKVIRDTWFESDSSGVCVGFIDPTNGSQSNLYICKFGGLGIPFDPTSAKAFESLKTEAVPIPFPNPGTDGVKFTILAGPGKVNFTDMKGRKVLEGEYLPEKGISTKSLPAGIYNYKLERNGKVWIGKWVKTP